MKNELKMMNLFVTPIRRLNHIKRFSFVPCIRVENVAEHSYFVTLYSLFLAEHARNQGLEIDKLKLLEASILHDAEEAMTGDIIRRFKYSNPILKNEIDKAATLALEGVFKNVEDATKHHFTKRVENAKDDSLEGRILAFSDLLSVYAYCLEEIRLGNKNMIDVFKEAQSYIGIFKNICNGFFNEFVKEIEEINPDTFNHSYYDYVSLADKNKKV